MRCYRCSAELSEHNFCTNCGADVGRYKKIIRMSNTFYNEGLEKAQIRDLSGAVVSLRQSLKFNKNNIKARNLLGLVYYEMGEVVAALSEWIISTNLRAKKNVATDYIERLQTNSAKLDILKQSVKNYNIALDRCKQPDGSDIAIIQLKKAINQNPKNLRAHLLLGLILLTTGKPALAKKSLEQARAIDVNNTMALRYLREAERALKPQDSKHKGKPETEETFSKTLPGSGVDGDIIQPTHTFHERKGSGAVLNIGIGVAIGVLIAYFLILPARIQVKQAEAQEEIKNFGTQLDAKNITITELEKTQSEQEDRIRSLTEKLNAYAGTEGTLASMENLLKAAAIYLSNPEDVLTVADYITSVDEESWTEDTSENYKNLYYALKKTIGPTVCDSYYAEGNSAYASKQYEDAIAYLEAAVFFDETDMDALYLLGNAYEKAEDKDQAKEAYNKVLELFPDTWYAESARKLLDKMNQ